MKVTLCFYLELLFKYFIAHISLSTCLSTLSGLDPFLSNIRNKLAFIFLSVLLHISLILSSFLIDWLFTQYYDVRQVMVDSFPGNAFKTLRESVHRLLAWKLFRMSWDSRMKFFSKEYEFGRFWFHSTCFNTLTYIVVAEPGRWTSLKQKLAIGLDPEPVPSHPHNIPPDVILPSPSRSPKWTFSMRLSKSLCEMGFCVEPK